jgi:hypothetical protein
MTVRADAVRAGWPGTERLTLVHDSPVTSAIDVN